MALPTCRIPRCTVTVAKHGLCLAHLRQAIDHQAARRADRACTFDGCDIPARANGLCPGHDTQRRRGHTLTPLRHRRTTCTNGCTRRHYARGLCRRCYDTSRPPCTNGCDTPQHARGLCRPCYDVERRAA